MVVRFLTFKEVGSSFIGNIIKPISLQRSDGSEGGGFLVRGMFTSGSGTIVDGEFSLSLTTDLKVKFRQYVIANGSISTDDSIEIRYVDYVETSNSPYKVFEVRVNGKLQEFPSMFQDSNLKEVLGL